MKQWGRRIRWAIGMGLTWGAAGFGAGTVLARVPGFYSDLLWGEFLVFGPPLAIAGAVTDRSARLQPAASEDVAHPDADGGRWCSRRTYCARMIS
jgi:hypothetical protein